MSDVSAVWKFPDENWTVGARRVGRDISESAAFFAARQKGVRGTNAAAAAAVSCRRDGEKFA